MKKQTIIVGAAILAATTGTTVFAEEAEPTSVAQPTKATEAAPTAENATPIQKAEKEVAKTSKDVTNAETSAKETFDKETQAKSDHDKATDEVKAAQDAVNKTNEKLKNAEATLAKDKELTPKLEKELQSNKDEVTNTENEISNTENQLTTAKEKQKTEEAKIQPQVDALNEATSSKEVAQDKVNSIKQDLKTNQANEATLTKEINDLTSAKEAANQNVTKTKTALDNAKTADKTRANNIASQKTIVAQDQRNKDNAIATEKAKTAEKEKLANDLTSAKNALADNLEIPVTDAYISALKAYKQNDSTANSNAVEKIAKEILNSKEVKDAMKLLKESDTRTVDPTNLTTEQLKELNIRMSQFIEDVRTKFGTFSPTMVRVSEESVNLSKLIGETYKNAIRKYANTTNPTVWNAAEMGHLKSSESVGANLAKAGYNTTAAPVRMETLAYSLETNMTTMGELKAEVYNSMIRWLYDDELSDWGHALIQSGLIWDYKKTELQTFVVQDGSYVMIGATETSLKEQDSTLKTKEYEIPATDYSKTVTRVNSLDKLIETNKAELAQATKNVKSTSDKLDASTKELKRLEAIEIQTPKAQTAYDSAVAKQTQLANQLTEKNNNLTAVQNKSKELNIALPEAESDLTKATETYNKAKAEYDKVSADVERAKAEVKRIEAQLKALNAKLTEAKNKVTNTEKSIAENNKEIETLTNSIKELKEQLKDQKTILKEKVKVQKEKEEIYMKAKGVADVERAKINELKSKHEVAVTYLESLKSEKAREVQKQRKLEKYNRMFDKVLYGTNTTANQNSNHTLPVTNSSNESVLPNTGSIEQSFMTYSALISLATAGYALARKKKED
ncbi:chromosome segregation protein [Streptococcus mitis]|uniref:Chromosome segregation protein n=1 Tax=Streptococcus mitis TaxID=28037 RepID=A0A3R9KGC3_STRMT|nr:SEC10/PgrA surface exclusion domain-containing protein [Streptococcus mitis]RSI82920.1 chromosome segregation protein [Streptococcus mitis]RSJ08833.1 chromosome segregation protein [Streptococcus mitis]